MPSHLFVVLRGKVRAIRRSESGREVTLETYHPGDFLADALRGPERPLSNDWEVAEPCDLLAIGRDAVAAQIVGTPGLALTLLNQTLDRLDRTKSLASGLALTDVPERVIAAVRTLASSSGKDVPEGVSVHNRPTQQELANSIGACRETVSRVISDLVRKGLIILRGRSIMSAGSCWVDCPPRRASSDPNLLFAAHRPWSRCLVSFALSLSRPCRPGPAPLPFRRAAAGPIHGKFDHFPASG